MKFVITAGFILLDLLTGIVKAFKERNFNSSTMREGLYHKGGSVIIISLASLLDYGQTFLDLGVPIPLTATACTYICLMEAGSIFENAGKINPEISSDKLKQYFTKLNGGEK